MKQATLITIAIFILSFTLLKDEEKPGFEKYFKEYKVEGSFVMYDLDKDRYTFYNKDNYRKAYTPASTFKIFNSLVALETGAIKDEHDTLRWDGVTRQNPAWNKDTDMAGAYRNSTVWFYQELARRAGSVNMQKYLDLANYGNRNMGGGLTVFWLAGDLRITPEQQIDFLRKLYKNELPFSQRSMDIVKKIMIAEKTDSYTLRAKTGRALKEELGWYVGYVEKKENVYFFATQVQTSDADNAGFSQSRIEITRNILKELGVIADN